MKEKMVGTPYERLTELIHLCPTSEDIDNIAKRVMFNIARDRILHPAQKKLVDTILTQAEKSSNAVMLGETHGQPAGVTTYGKEMLIFGIRLKDQLQKAREIKLKGKFNGLIGTYSGFQAAFRDKVSLETWVEFTKKFVGSFGLDPILTTTQGNPNDDLVEFLQSIQLFNEISHSLAQDVWSYIDQGELVQNARGAGSSTSAAKVNPWRGEHSETMFELANGQIDVYVRNLPETRRQRDLSDKTMMRFIGESLAICTNGWRYLGQQIGSTAPNREKMMEMILQDYSWLSEAVQLVLRESGVQGGYELIKQKMQGRTFSREQFAELIDRTIVECFSVPLREDGLHLNEAELSEEQLATITKLQSLSPQQFIDDALKLTQILLKEEGLEE
jgi:adenylosuccinate lyase